MNSKDIRTGDRVLCKVGDFPPWPAVVVPQRFLSKLVYSGKRSKSYVCVAFFNDDSYYWKEPRHLTLLTDKMCTDWMKNSKSKDEALIGAYQQAIEYKRLFDFMKERLVQEEREEILEDVKDIPAGEDPFEPKPTTRRTGSTKSSVSRKRARSVSAPGNSAPLSHTDGLGPAGDTKAAHPILASASSPSFSKTSSLSKRRKLDYDNRVSIAQLLRNKLQRNLVQRNEPPSEKEYKESDRMFRTIINKLSNDPPFFDYKALRVSKLYKLLKVIAQDENLARYHDDCNKILATWAPLIVQIKQEKQMAQQLDTSTTDDISLVSDVKVGEQSSKSLN
ncbi:AEL263Cp [Eremothecium gossypii ATCC 10895]|uniref:AEL263Cp n=1 Tax=Eremothecium gossypii (strain ATCC 10895 / CBS 109.51 / FGSC 9923 / NRRL Y-1056) TaxID=284811 RepID=Q758M5_EREGS|nr:AEL263Cp [Eremothecium gossypii ATCC 10895]AAS52421.1 AEL263Cp [Eremothecium gossypii ATCC 10895]AEY96719.1 FAEL263Cp [Eremothecium gossypii FDAG1]